MPPRRSVRAASAKPAASAPEKPKLEPRSRSRPPKRPASPEQSQSPPPVAKRPRTTAKEAPNGIAKDHDVDHHPKVNGKAATKTTKLPAVSVQSKPYFNPLPTPPEHSRPALQLFVWGAGNFGQFGMGEDELGEYSKPKMSKWVKEGIEEKRFGDEEEAGLESVAAGGLHTLFIDEKGVIWSCGVNDDAALGRVTKNIPNPDKTGEFLDIDSLTAVPHPVQSLVDDKFRAVRIAAGDSISAAISSEGDLRVWGSFRANEGSLGFSNDHRHQFLPVPILELPAKPGDVEKFVSVASGNNHLLVLTTHGNLYTWGAGEQGQLGRKVIERRKIHGTVPEKVVLGSRLRKAVVIGAGNYHSFAVDDSGDVWGWGLNSMGQTGTGVVSKTDSPEVQQPKKIAGLSKDELDGETVIEIAGGEHHTIFLTSGGRVFACGRSDRGQLGLPDEHEAFKDRPDFISTPRHILFPDSDDPVRHITAGTHSNLAVTEGGALYSWGDAAQGELGLGGEDNARTPAVVVRRSGGSWAAVAVACGGQHALALLRKKP